MIKIIENYQLIKDGIKNCYISSKVSTELSFLDSPTIAIVEHNINNPSKLAEIAGYGLVRNYGNFKINNSYTIFCSYIGSYNYVLYYDGVENITWDHDYSVNNVMFFTDKNSNKTTVNDKVISDCFLYPVSSFISPDGKDITQQVIYCLKNRTPLMNIKRFENSIKEMFHKIYVKENG